MHDKDFHIFNIVVDAFYEKASKTQLFQSPELFNFQRFSQNFKNMKSFMAALQYPFSTFCKHISMHWKTVTNKKIFKINLCQTKNLLIFKIDFKQESYNFWSSKDSFFKAFNFLLELISKTQVGMVYFKKPDRSF